MRKIFQHTKVKFKKLKYKNKKFKHKNKKLKHKNKKVNVSLLGFHTYMYKNYHHSRNQGTLFSMRTRLLIKVTVDLRSVFWGKQYSALCTNGKYINLYIIAELI